MDTPRGAKEWGICGHHQGYQGKGEHMDPRKGAKERGYIRISPGRQRKGAHKDTTKGAKEGGTAITRGIITAKV